MIEVRLDSLAEHEQARMAYDSLYKAEDISQLDSFYTWVIRHLNLSPGMRYLDVACGRGELAYKARQLHGNGFGSDISEQAIWNGRRLFADNPLTVADGAQLPYAANSFDVVSSMGSLEHYEDMARGIREMARVVKPDGQVLILVPNTYSLLTNILSAYRTGYTSLDNQPIQRYAARSEWTDLINANGLRVIKTRKYERAVPTSLADAWWYLQRPKQAFRLLMQPLIPTNLAFCFLFFCHKEAAP